MGKAWSTRKLKSSTSEILGAHWSLLCEGLDVKKMVKSFEAEIITKIEKKTQVSLKEY